jgi:hypothetical protein
LFISVSELFHSSQPASWIDGAASSNEGTKAGERAQAKGSGHSTRREVIVANKAIGRISN